MARFTVPSQAREQRMIIEGFRGVDLNNSPSNVDKTRSPAAPNMIRDQVGKVRKRMGYETVATAPEGATVYGVHRLGEETLVHAGTKLYRWDGADTFTVLGDMAEARSRSVTFDGNLYLLDGTKFRVYDGQTLKNVEEAAYVPTIIISRTPTGGGTAYEALNLIGKKWTESFLGTADATVYQLTADELSDTVVTAEVLTAQGAWTEKTEGTDFTVNRTTGAVTFSTAPGLSPVTGMDNVHITAAKERDGYAERINLCTVLAMYGVGGAADRVFLSGNDNMAGTDWYSGFENPAYMPDTGYTHLALDGSRVVGYAAINNTLAAFLSGGNTGRNAVIRTGTIDTEGEALFRITNTLMGQEAVAKDSFCRTDKEPLFLTRRGVYAITAEELTGEKYSQERSHYIADALQTAEGKERAMAAVYNDFYFLALDGTIYVMDLKQKAYEKDSPYSSFQYECYYFPGFAPTALWTDGSALWFATSDGKLRRFFSDTEAMTSYNDDGQSIDAYWETSDFDGQAFYDTKTYTGLGVRLAAAPQTGVTVFAQQGGIWSQVFDAGANARYFSFAYVDFSKMSFSGDTTPRTLWTKIKLKKVDKARFRLQNNALNEPFGLYAFGLTWRETGTKYKR